MLFLMLFFHKKEAKIQTDFSLFFLEIHSSLFLLSATVTFITGHDEPASLRGFLVVQGHV